MTEDKKIGRWAKSLDKAGLLDPIEDSWEMQDGDTEKSGTIVVDKRSTDMPVASDTPVPPLPDLPPSWSVGTTARTTDPATLLDLGTDDLRRQMKARFDVADYTGALTLADKLLALDEEAEDASMMRLKCRNTLMQMFESRIGSFRRIPVRVVSEQDIVWRNLDATTAFIASNVDGTLSFEDIVDISTVSRFDTCRILSQLLQEGIIK